MPPVGKPDPHAPRGLVETRPHVAQSNQKGLTCWYYALKILRQQYGHDPHPSLLPQREIEQRISQYRKELTATSNQLYKEQSYLEGFRMFQQMTAHFIQLPARECLEQMGSGQERDLLYEIVKEAKDVPLESWLYVRCAQRLAALYKKFCTEFHIDIPHAWEQLDLRHQICYLAHAMIHHTAKKLYGLRIAAWHPTRPVDTLIQELNTRKWMMVSGLFGSGFYEHQRSGKFLKEKITRKRRNFKTPFWGRKISEI